MADYDPLDDVADPCPQCGSVLDADAGKGDAGLVVILRCPRCGYTAAVSPFE